MENHLSLLNFPFAKQCDQHSTGSSSGGLHYHIKKYRKETNPDHNHANEIPVDPTGRGYAANNTFYPDKERQHTFPLLLPETDIKWMEEKCPLPCRGWNLTSKKEGEGKTGDWHHQKSRRRLGDVSTWGTGDYSRN